ncbi:PREDICTED: tryptophan--tRNA ligase, mitochondrial, partial [Ceratosolen solmsi marchali]|uniref:Tryptophan--tRNA ligase, mitochondrial n=1 Tax=Ceratosolen solmsi marchali TaxID=326594 RepID=A0AAJ7E1S8_9HYME
MFYRIVTINISFCNQLKIIPRRRNVELIKRYCATNKILYPKTIFSGIQPTGSVHIGNYFGAIENWVKLQENGENVIWSIVDMHAITLQHNSTELKENILKLTAVLLACGIDPNKSILFQQSSVSMHAELSWILACLTTMPRLAHQPQYKEKSQTLKDVPLGLYIYPILQTADILLYKATHVPVGEDQVQHIQLAEHLAQKFNTTYGETFPMPIAVINKDFGRIKSLRDPLQKMSKSESDTKSRLNLTDEPAVLLNKIKKAVTDFTSVVSYDPENRPGVSNLVSIHSMITGMSPEEICKEVKHLNTGQYKLFLADILIDKLNPIREKIQLYMNQPKYLQKVLHEGTQKAKDIAFKNWLEVKDKVGYGTPIFSNNQQ